MMKTLFPALILSASSVAVLYPAPANAQLDFWNKPKVEYSSQMEALNACMEKMPAAIAFYGRQTRKKNGLKPHRVKDAYCIAYQNSKWKNLGNARGEYTYYYTEEFGNPDQITEIKKLLVLPAVGTYKWTRFNRRVTLEAPQK